MIDLSANRNQLRIKKMEISSLLDIIFERLPLYKGRPVIRIDNGNSYDNIESEDYLANIYRMISFFYNTSNDQNQQVVATFVKNRPEWDMTAFACWYTGNIIFPLDTKMNEEELKNLLSINPPAYMLISKAQLLRMRALLKELEISSNIIICDLYEVFEDIGCETPEYLEKNESLLSKAIESYDNKLHHEPRELLKNEKTVLCHYATSGTVSLPKIVELTHGNLIFQVNNAMDVINIRQNEDYLNLGPYTHIGTLIEFLLLKAKQFTVSYFTREADDDDVLEDEIKKLKKQGVRIRGLMAVPKFWIYIMKEVLEEMKNKPVLHNLYKQLISIEKNTNFYDIGTLDKAKLVSVRSFIRNKMGGNFAFGISSSTKLDPAIIDIFSKLGITVIDIYGATEVCGVIAKNSLNESRRGSCGRLIPGLEVKLVNVTNIPGVPFPSGELYVKGPAVANGYKGNHLFMTDAEGFYNTGDIAYIDQDNWVYLVGRKKELVQWSDGSYIDLMRLSNLLVRSVWLKDAMAVRLKENDDFFSVFIFPDYKRIHKDLRYQSMSKSGFTKNQVLRLFFEEAIDYAQSLLGAQPILSKEKIYILEQKLERTPTHKIKFVSELKKLNTEIFI